MSSEAEATNIDVEIVEKLIPIMTKPKRIKIVVGGRGSTKSTGIADWCVSTVATGELWCCARETQNSIEESVHRTNLEEIERLGLPGFFDTKTEIRHPFSGGRIFYRGLSRNITSLKSTLSGVFKLWIEEGEDIKAATLRVLTASVRLNATDTRRALEGEDITFPEIIITMNRGARDGAIAQTYLKRAEKELERCGYYEDDTIMVVQLNYTDMPEEWFLQSGLEQERKDDYQQMSRAAYDHKWHGAYLDEIDNAIIKKEWVDAATDAHLLPHLKAAFKPHGAKIATHDPFDDGNDAGSFVLRHGSIIQAVKIITEGEIDESCEWATDETLDYGADWFVWDGDGMGTGLKRQVSTALKGTRTNYHLFKGSLSGSGQDNAKKIYMPVEDDNETGKIKKKLKYQDVFLNNRAQYYVELATRLYNTYRCVERGEYVDPAEMLSINSKGVVNQNGENNMSGLRSQLCRIPMKVRSSRALKQILSKAEMKTLGIPSPNEADGIMMSLWSPPVTEPEPDMSIPNQKRL
ncbi:MAG: phage terminase large subunit [Sneathiella sp.]